ncbi:G-protein coupled receptor Mth-like isoform X2 [Sitophilus oryzae]|uniref:G-protein coupled receptor Mth-like isoform X2 n=1 Tax=Sitophilus oryzae TaxID=7048 RepID=A0A6J2XP55_SITOR|nr:G-protein coupled receptor Mth-like isoform X2 [Sitophilus oryzae]
MILLFLLLFSTALVKCSSDLCSNILRVNITEGLQVYNLVIFDGIVFQKSNYFVKDSTLWGCPCSVRNCIRKCCPESMELVMDNPNCIECTRTNRSFSIQGYTNSSQTINDFFTIYGDSCPPNYIGIKSKGFKIEKNGYLIDVDYYPPDLYCLDYVNREMVAKLCVIPIESSRPRMFFYVVMGISTVCFALTAASYGLLLNESDIIKKKCVIFFSASMFVVFLSLVILSVQSNYTVCRIFGFVFFTFTIFSFVWLSISCFELFYMVKVARENNRQAWRLHWYLGVSTGIALLMLLISLFSGEEWTPDMPDTFIRNSNSCNFLVPFERFLILYIPMVISVIVAIVFIVLAQRLINKNDVDPRINIDCDWVANRNSYKFMCRTYMVIILATLFWFPHLFYNGVSSQLALDALEGALGILTLCTFVLDKYTMPKIWAKLKRKKKLNEASLGLQNIPTPTTAELEPSQETPFMFHGNAHNNHNNTGNNNGG